MSRPTRYGWRDNYLPGPEGKTSAPIPKDVPKAAPPEISHPQAAAVILPAPTDALTALKRRAHRDGPPVNWEGGFQT